MRRKEETKDWWYHTVEINEEERPNVPSTNTPNKMIDQKVEGDRRKEPVTDRELKTYS